jgi:hypothetical protein
MRIKEAKLLAALSCSMITGCATLAQRQRYDAVRHQQWIEEAAHALRRAHDDTLLCSKPQEDVALAQRYAPILLLAPHERYRPTIPFFSAFYSSTAGPDDWRKALVPATTELGGMPWKSIDSAYFASQALNRPAVFFSVAPLGVYDRLTVYRYLRSDKGAWNHLGLENREMILSALESEQLRVIRYAMYYVNDDGIGHHHDDIEHYFLIVSADTAIPTRFYIAIGDAHTENQASNVLVFARDPRLQEEIEYPWVMVEQGGHANSPDLAPHGVFSVGHDINWHLEDISGIRDVISTAGLGWAGGYTQWMTIPRDPQNSVLLYHPSSAAASDTSITRWAPNRRLEYSLISTTELGCLSGLIADRTKNRDEILARTGRLAAEMGSNVDEPVVWSLLADKDADVAVSLMRYWLLPYTHDVAHRANDRMPWRHERYLDWPMAILKPILVQPPATGLGLVTTAVGAPTIDVSYAAPPIWPARMRFRGRWQVGIQMRTNGLYRRIHLLYTPYNRALMTWYLDAAYGTRDRIPTLSAGRADSVSSRTWLEIGTRLLPSGFPHAACWLHPFELRIGARTPLSSRGAAALPDIVVWVNFAFPVHGNPFESFLQSFHPPAHRIEWGAVYVDPCFLPRSLRNRVIQPTTPHDS